MVSKIIKDLSLDSPITNLCGVGSVYKKAFYEAGIIIIRDLLWSLPYRYIDRGDVINLDRLYSNISYYLNREQVTIFGILQNFRLKKNDIKQISVVEATIYDSKHLVSLIWFNRPYILNKLVLGSHLLIFGKPNIINDIVQFINPKFDIVNKNSSNVVATNRYIPLYKKIGPVTSLIRKRLVKEALRRIFNDNEHFESVGCTLEIALSLQFLHQPHNDSDMNELGCGVTIAHHRLIVEELYSFVSILEQRSFSSKVLSDSRVNLSYTLIKKIKNYLPFKLTFAQRKVLQEIISDLTSGNVMHRLLYGDVGSGKTLVAFLAMSLLVETGRQAVIIVPTEALAYQHAATFIKILNGEDKNIQLLLGAMKNNDKDIALKRIASGQALYIIGTHALFQEIVIFNKLGLVVIDEQQRFGVKQRSLMLKKGVNPHLLMMSATPIPRSLAMTFFGNLNQSILNELPFGRKSIITRVVCFRDIDEIWQIVDQELSFGHKIFVVSSIIGSPLISNSLIRDVYCMQTLLENRFPKQKITLIHGRLKSWEINDRIKGFIDGASNILLATTIIEVGIDVFCATVMIVDNAEHFGLSQLHQLRGRIGRNFFDNYFFMISDDKSVRLSVIAETQDGFYIAQKDLEIRGPGEPIGSQQSGLLQFEVANLVCDDALFGKCRGCIN